MRRRFVEIISSLALPALGAALMYYLLLQHVGLEYGGGSERSFCSLNATFDCDSVSASEHAEIFGIPWAALGIGFYLALFFLYMFYFLFEAQVNRVIAAILLLLTGFSTILFVLFVAIMAFVIGKYCLLCLVCHGIDLGLFGLTLAIVKKKKEALQAFVDWLKGGFVSCEQRALLPIVAVILFIFAGSIVLPKVIAYDFLDDDIKSGLERRVAQFILQKEVVLDYPKSALVYGDGNAPLKIVEFSDFQCVFCKKSAFLLDIIIPLYQGKVDFYFKDFPLSTKCRSDLPRDIHPYACEAARLGICAREFGVFWSFHRDVFKRQEKIFASDDPTGILVDIIVEAGIDRDSVLRCYEDEITMARLRKDIAEGTAIGIKGTPGLFIDGKIIQGEKTAVMVKTILDRTLERKKR